MSCLWGREKRAENASAAQAQAQASSDSALGTGRALPSCQRQFRLPNETAPTAVRGSTWWTPGANMSTHIPGTNEKRGRSYRRAGHGPGQLRVVCAQTS